MSHIIFLYSGQGSRYYHMDEKLYQQNIVFQENVQKLGTFCEKQLERSIIEYISDQNEPNEW